MRVLGVGFASQKWVLLGAWLAEGAHFVIGRWSRKFVLPQQRTCSALLAEHILWRSWPPQRCPPETHVTLSGNAIGPWSGVSQRIVAMSHLMALGRHPIATFIPAYSRASAWSTHTLLRGVEYRWYSQRVLLGAGRRCMRRALRGRIVQQLMLRCGALRGLRRCGSLRISLGRPADIACAQQVRRHCPASALEVGSVLRVAQLSVGSDCSVRISILEGSGCTRVCYPPPALRRVWTKHCARPTTDTSMSCGWTARERARDKARQRF